jgi:hypothetical protein
MSEKLNENQITIINKEVAVIIYNVWRLYRLYTITFKDLH